MSFLYCDGLICSDDEALFTANNSAFRSGEGLLETMYSKHNSIRLLDLHLERLAESLRHIDFPPLDADRFRQAIGKTLAANGDPEQAIVRATCFLHPDDEDLHVLIELVLTDVPTGQWPEKGLTLGITRQATTCFNPISHLKTTSRMLYRMARKDATAQGWDDALLLNEHGRIAESTRSNIFAIMDNVIYTPPLNEGCISGVMRTYLLRHESMNPFSFVEKDLTVAVLQQADEIFLTNAVRGIQPVSSFMGKAFSSAKTRMVFDKSNI